MYIPPAATWIRLAGPTIYKLCVDRYKDTATCRFLEAGCTLEWTGGEGFSLDRWQFWKRKLGELAAEQRLDNHLRTVAKEAEASMESTERAAI
jgi:hypothetical protein